MPPFYRPCVEPQTIPDLVRSLYGLHITVVQELVSYEDQNFLVQLNACTVKPESHRADDTPVQFVFKVSSAQNSKNTDVLDVQTEVILHVKHAAFPISGPVRALDGQYRTTAEVLTSHPDGPRKEKCVVRLFDFMPGVTLFKVSLTPTLCYELGACTAHLNSILKDFPVDEHCRRTLVHKDWHLFNVPWLLSKLHIVRNAEERQTCREVIQAFDENIVRCQHKFRQGLTHGDLNDCNVVVCAETELHDSPGGHEGASQTEVIGHNGDALHSLEKSSSGEKPVFHVRGFIDYENICFSPYLLEVAIAIAYVMLKPRDVTPITAAAWVLTGYLKVMTLPLEELRLLKLSICARFVQSSVLGYCSSQEDPENEYILLHVKNIWPVLKNLWRTPDEDVLAQLLVHTDFANDHVSE